MSFRVFRGLLHHHATLSTLKSPQPVPDDPKQRAAVALDHGASAHSGTEIESRAGVGDGRFADEDVASFALLAARVQSIEGAAPALTREGFESETQRQHRHRPRAQERTDELDQWTKIVRGSIVLDDGRELRLEVLRLRQRGITRGLRRAFSGGGSRVTVRLIVS